MTSTDPANAEAKQPRSTGDWIGRTTAVLGIASILAYAFGWLFARTYLGVIGASWYLNSLPYQTVVAEGWLMLWIILVGAAIAVLHMWTGRSSRSADWFSLALMAVAAVGFLYAAYLSNGLARGAILGLSQSIVGLNVGFTLGEMAWGFGYGKYKWGERNTWILLCTWSFLLFIPTQSARMRAEADIDPAVSRLSQITAPALKGDWRVVYVSGETALVGLMSRDSGTRSHALVKLTDPDTWVLPAPMAVANPGTAASAVGAAASGARP